MRVTSLLVLGAALTGCDYGLTVVDGQLAPAAVRSVDIDDPRDGETLTVSWRPPAGATVRVLRTVGDDPTSSTDASAIAVYEGRDTEVVDRLTDIEVGTSVHYGVFVVDGEAASAGVFAAEVLSAFLSPQQARAVANTDGTVQLSWSAPAVLGDVVGYRVRRDDVEITSSVALDTTLLDTTAPLDVLSTYEIVGVDDDGNETPAITATATAIAPRTSVANTVVLPSLFTTAHVSDGDTLWVGGFLDDAATDISFGDDAFVPTNTFDAVLARAHGEPGIVATFNVQLDDSSATVDDIAIAGNGDIVAAVSYFGLDEHSFTVGDNTTTLPPVNNNDDDRRLVLVRISASGTVLWHTEVVVGDSAQVDTFVVIDADDTVWCATTAYTNSTGSAVRLPLEVAGRSALVGTPDGPDAFVMHVDGTGQIDNADLVLDTALRDVVLDDDDGVVVGSVSSAYDIRRLTFGDDGRLTNTLLHSLDEAYGLPRLVRRNDALLAVADGLSQALVVDGVAFDTTGTAIVAFADDGTVRASAPTVLVNGEPGYVELDIAALDDGTLAVLVKAYKPGSFDSEGNVPLAFTITWGPITVEAEVVANSFGGGEVSLFALLPDLEPTSTFDVAVNFKALVPAGDAVWVGAVVYGVEETSRILDVEVPHSADDALTSVFALVQP